jgi:hypothetical protein
MKRIALLVGIAFASTPAFAALEPVTVTPQPNTEIDSTARSIVADELARALAGGDAPLVLVGQARLGRPKDQPALFIQLQSARECGSAGCSTSVYLRRGNAWAVVLDSVGGVIKVDSVRHGGMRYLLVDGDGRWVWNGSTYRDTRPAAKIDLKPKRP